MTLQGTNTWVLAAPGSTGRVVVDPGPLGDAHLEAVAAAGPVDLVLLTHRHPDHAAGAHRFREMVGAPMAAVDPAYTVDAEPLGAGTVVAGGLSIEVTPTPGHTSDSSPSWSRPRQPGFRWTPPC
jgi:glyoxylase-like metal-dependent hydrolase (beta-lactamase superfamily II)